MEDNIIFRDKPASAEETGGKPTHTPSLVIGILSIVLGLLIPLAGEILGVIGIVMSRKHRLTHKTKAAFVCSIVGLLLSVANHLLAILLILGQ